MRRARSIRDEASLSLRQVEELTGIDHSAVSKFETGLGMGIENIGKLAACYGEKLERQITIDELVQEEAAVGG